MKLNEVIQQMELNEAIHYHEQMADKTDLEYGLKKDDKLYPMTEEEYEDYKKCFKEHIRYADWLKELKEYREQSRDAIYKQAANTDLLTCVLDKIEEEINSPNRGTCDYSIIDKIEEIINDYKAEIESHEREDKE